MDLSIARLNMIQQQIRTWDVLDPNVLDVFNKSPRERFVAPAFKTLAFSDASIPIGHNQVTLPPKTIGRIIQALDLSPKNHVLEIGTGTGYITSLLSRLVKKVVTIEIIPELAEEALQHFQELHLHNIKSEVGDGTAGWPNEGPYDAILLTGSLPVLPKILGKQLVIGGRLFALLGNPPAISAVLLTRINKDQFSQKILFETQVPPLIHSLQYESFIL